tara:strand:- start:452 stop:769 length:318 start_codon:yes stop_codon:yes gene_type:complete
MDEFNEDLNRIKYIKRLLGRYQQKGILKERLILNHMIILGNLFGPVPTCRILFFKIEERLHSSLRTFLEFLNYIPPISSEIPEVSIEDIPTDLNVVKTLKEMPNE